MMKSKEIVQKAVQLARPNEGPQTFFFLSEGHYSLTEVCNESMIKKKKIGSVYVERSRKN